MGLMWGIMRPTIALISYANLSIFGALLVFGFRYSVGVDTITIDDLNIVEPSKLTGYVLMVVGLIGVGSEVYYLIRDFVIASAEITNKKEG